MIKQTKQHHFIPDNESDKASPQRFQKHQHITVAGMTAIEHLAECTDLSRQNIKQAMKNGAVWLESSQGIARIRRATKTLAIDNKLHLYYDKTIQSSKAETAVLIDDRGEYSIWNKPSGMYSQGTKWGDHCTIYRWAENHLKPQRPAFLVHRLDKAANGLIIIAHTKTMAAAFSALFQARKITKQYRAVIENYDKSLTTPFVISTSIDGKSALSRIIDIKPQKNNTALIKIEIETGRKHQIRQHLAGAGFPIIGDRLYGSGLSPENLKLQSCYLGFDCPISRIRQEYKINEENLRSHE